MAQKYFKPSDWPGMPKDGRLKTPEQKMAFEKWRETHPNKPSGRPAVGKPTESSRKQAAKYATKSTKK